MEAFHDDKNQVFCPCSECGPKQWLGDCLKTSEWHLFTNYTNTCISFCLPKKNRKSRPVGWVTFNSLLLQDTLHVLSKIIQTESTADHRLPLRITGHITKGLSRAELSHHQSVILSFKIRYETQKKIIITKREKGTEEKWEKGALSQRPRSHDFLSSMTLYSKILKYTLKTSRKPNFLDITTMSEWIYVCVGECLTSHVDMSKHDIAAFTS